jgi:hypothetical protein
LALKLSIYLRDAREYMTLTQSANDPSSHHAGDRIADADYLYFEVYGVRIAVQTAVRVALPRLRAVMLPNCETGRPPDLDVLYQLIGNDGLYTLLLDDRPLHKSPELDLILDRFASDVHHRVAERSESMLFVHAGVVSHRGKALVIPGRSRVGKTTLIAALLQLGATYYSDEYAVFDDRGMVLPYPKRLAMRGRITREARQFKAAEEFGSQTGSGAIPLGALAQLEHEPRHGWAVKAMTSGQAVLALLDNTVLARARTGDALARFSLAVPGATLISGTRGEAIEAAETLLSLMEGVV